MVHPHYLIASSPVKPPWSWPFGFAGSWCYRWQGSSVAGRAQRQCPRGCAPGARGGTQICAQWTVLAQAHRSRAQPGCGRCRCWGPWASPLQRRWPTRCGGWQYRRAGWKGRQSPWPAWWCTAHRVCWNVCQSRPGGLCPGEGSKHGTMSQYDRCQISTDAMRVQQWWQHSACLAQPQPMPHEDLWAQMHSAVGIGWPPGGPEPSQRARLTPWRRRSVGSTATEHRAPGPPSGHQTTAHPALWVTWTCIGPSLSQPAWPGSSTWAGGGKGQFVPDARWRHYPGGPWGILQKGAVRSSGEPIPGLGNLSAGK